jgi:hypothetical protein
MKIALCLYGYFNNREDSSAGMKGYQYIKDTILKYPNVDVFVHSWDLENENKIKELYKPKLSVFEKQVDYEALAKTKGVYQKNIDKDFDRNNTIYFQCTIQASLSFFSSRAMSIILKNSYENGNEFEYDVVITARFDLGHRSKMHRGYNVSQMNFNPNADMKYLYSSMWVQLNAGYADQWFYSNSKNMNSFVLMQEHFFVDFKVDSEYNKALNNGWFDSNAADEFSNEMLKPSDQRSNNLMKYPTWQMVNNHLYHKWFLNKAGLYEVSKFV